MEFSQNEKRLGDLRGNRRISAKMKIGLGDLRGNRRISAKSEDGLAEMT